MNAWQWIALAVGGDLALFILLAALAANGKRLRNRRQAREPFDRIVDHGQLTEHFPTDDTAEGGQTMSTFYAHLPKELVSSPNPPIPDGWTLLKRSGSLAWIRAVDAPEWVRGQVISPVLARHWSLDGSPDRVVVVTWDSAETSTSNDMNSKETNS